MAKHTSGPWVVRFRMGHGGRIRCYRVGPEHVADAAHGGICLYDDVTSLNPHASGEQEANARLIAAAPDLLEAAENLENDDGSIPEHAWKLLQDAIAKAKGRDA